jgi:hypothetical protein
MKIIERIQEFDGIPFTLRSDINDESVAEDLLSDVIEKAEEVIGTVIDVKNGNWTNNPTTMVRAVFGHWIAKATIHFLAILKLCEDLELSVVAIGHHRQIFELFIQSRYFASLSAEEEEKYANEIYIIGCLEYLEQMEVMKNHDYGKSGYDEINEKLAREEEGIVEEIRDRRKKRKFNWFSRSFSQLAKDVSKAGEDLKIVYQIISTEVHGKWDLVLEVDNPEPGVLDFRGYPDRTTLLKRTIEMVDQVTTLYMNLWDEIAESVGAEKVFYLDESY